MAASKSCIKFTTHEFRSPASRCKSVSANLLIVGVHWGRPMEEVPSGLSTASPVPTFPNAPTVSHAHARPRQSPPRRLQWVQWVQWVQWLQCVQCLLESLVRHLKPRRASMLVVKLLVDQGGEGRLAEGRISSRRPTVVPEATMEARRRGLRIAARVVGFRWFRRYSLFHN